MLRRSRYVITVPGKEDEYLFVNTFSGAMMVGTAETQNILEGEIDDSDEEMLSNLISSGFLTELNPKEETERAFKKIETIRKIYREHTLFVLILTYECNMRCDYCFQNYVFGRDENWLHKRMQAEHVDAAYKAMEKLNPDTKNPIHLFGGEPLIYHNYDLVQYILEKGTDKGKSFIIVTNGLEADKFIPLLSRSNIVSLQITLDGTEKVHNKRKKKLDGTGSFQDIVKSIESLVEAGIGVVVKATFDHSNVRTLPALADFMREKGWIHSKNPSVYITTVRHHTAGGCYNFVCNLEPKDLEFVVEDEVLSYLFWAGLSPMKLKLGFQDTWVPQISYCRHNPSQTWFDPFGDIYLCTDSLGDKEHAVGTYYPELTFNKQYHEWMKRTTFDMRSCRHCNYAMICGGGCGHHTYHEKGGILKPDCTFSQQALKIYYPLIWKMIQTFRKNRIENRMENSNFILK